ncbi:hypothetical protein BDZ45DRAFT_743297 [Acephala macrosclerotiorum]|nr:hypothetical protein BDZ45DRAFT_743297 [Acephala macrosclerotiorum]
MIYSLCLNIDDTSLRDRDRRPNFRRGYQIGVTQFHDRVDSLHGISPLPLLEMYGSRSLPVSQAVFQGKWNCVASSKNAHNTKKFLAGIAKLCETSDTNFSLTGHEIYSCASDRQSAHFLIPIAGQELDKTIGFIQQAAEGSLQGYRAPNDALVALLPLDAANVDEPKMTKYQGSGEAIYVGAMSAGATGKFLLQ